VRETGLVQDLAKEFARIVKVEPMLDTILTFAKPCTQQLIKLGLGASESDGTPGTVARS